MARQLLARSRTHEAVGFFCRLVFFCLLTAGSRLGAQSAEPLTFDLKEISVFDVPEAVRTQLLSGADGGRRTEPDKDVRHYPVFKSDKPLYGSFHVGGMSTEPEMGYHYPFALDESAGSGQGYDRMYIDTNLNGDLTDDAYCRPRKDVPERPRSRYSLLTTEVFFESVRLRVTREDDPQHGLEVMPRFLAFKGNRQYAGLVTTKAYAGVIQIGRERVYAVLGHSQGIPGWFDHPGTGLYLLTAKQSRSMLSSVYGGGGMLSSWVGGNRLKAMSRRGDSCYRFSATPSGDKLFVWPYQGPFGALEITSGGHHTGKVSAIGSLASRDAALATILTSSGVIALYLSLREWSLPEGKYEKMTPHISIARSDGEIVSQGPMPFYGSSTRGYSWRVPEELKLDGDEETFTITVTYDTRELYGTVTGTRTFAVCRD